MGTNYYVRIIPTKKRKEEITDLIMNSNNFSKILNEISKTFGSIEFDYDTQTWAGGNIHLGKRSAGWKFLWNPNQYKVNHGHIEHYINEEGVECSKYVEDPYTVFNYYDLTKDSIKKFIDREDVEIYDEYGEKQDKEEFFDMAVNWTTWTDSDGQEKEAWDGDSYAKWERENNKRYYSYPKTIYCYFLEEIGYTLNKENTDFYSDGLRFSTSTEFS